MHNSISKWKIELLFAQLYYVWMNILKFQFKSLVYVYKQVVCARFLNLIFIIKDYSFKVSNEVWLINDANETTVIQNGVWIVFENFLADKIYLLKKNV